MTSCGWRRFLTYRNGRDPGRPGREWQIAATERSSGKEVRGDRG